MLAAIISVLAVLAGGFIAAIVIVALTDIDDIS
jgi:hypothetical protein